MPPKNQLEKRFDALEAAVHKHFEESGEIRTDLAWIKKWLFMCAAAALASAGSLIVTVIIALANLRK